MIKLYSIIFISELVAFYSFIMIGIKDSNSYITLGFLGIYFATKHSLLLRKKEKLKNIYFSLLVLGSALLMYIYFFKRYDISFISIDSLWFVMFLGLTIYQDYMFRTYTLERLKKIYKW